MALASTEAKNKALTLAAAAIRRDADKILEANRRDVEAVKGKLSESMIDRLGLDPKRVESIAKGLEEVAALPDPVGTSLARWSRPNGLDIERVRVPLGVIGIIYESRPNVTADAGALCLKAAMPRSCAAGRKAPTRPAPSMAASSPAPWLPACRPTRCRSCRRRIAPRSESCLAWPG